MTVSEFDLLVRQGRGSAILKLRAETDKAPFRKTVINAALTDLRFDSQCSDDQAWFVCQLISEFDAPEELISEIESHYTDDFSDNFSHYAETLALLCKRGRKRSGEILKELYDTVSKKLLDRQTAPEAIDTELFDFLSLLTTAAGENVPITRIISDIDKLLQKDGLFQMWDFDSEISYLLDKQIINKKIFELPCDSPYMKNNPAFSRVVFAYKQEKERQSKLREKRENKGFEDAGTFIEYIKSGKPLDRGMKKYMRMMKPEEALTVSELAYSETDIKRKTVLYAILPAFVSGDMSRLAEEARKYEYALNDPESPEYFLELKILDKLGNGIVSAPELLRYAEEFLAKDYPEDLKIELRTQLYSASEHDSYIGYIKNIPVTLSEDDCTWHSAHYSAVTLCQTRDDAPYDLLPYIFENTLCASCRARALRIMNDKGLLTDEILAEGRYDREEKIRCVCRNMNLNCIIEDMKRAGIEFESGLPDETIGRIEAVYGISFPDSLRLFYSKGLPVSDGFVRWNDFSEENINSIKERLAQPEKSLLYDVEKGFWLDKWGEMPPDGKVRSEKVKNMISKAPGIIPVFSHRYIASGEGGTPVLSAVGRDIIYYGSTLGSYLSNEFLNENFRYTSHDGGCGYYIPFWSDIISQSRTKTV